MPERGGFQGKIFFSDYACDIVKHVLSFERWLGGISPRKMSPLPGGDGDGGGGHFLGNITPPPPHEYILGKCHNVSGGGISLG